MPYIEDVIGWVCDAFSAAGASPRIGARLALILEQAGLQDVTTVGVQAYVPPHSRAGANLLAGVVRSLSTAIVKHRIATAEELDLPTLEDRIADELRRADAVMLPPTVVGAWERSADLLTGRRAGNVVNALPIDYCDFFACSENMAPCGSWRSRSSRRPEPPSDR